MFLYYKHRMCAFFFHFIVEFRPMNSCYRLCVCSVFRIIVWTLYMFIDFKNAMLTFIRRWIGFGSLQLRCCFFSITFDQNSMFQTFARIRNPVAGNSESIDITVEFTMDSPANCKCKYGWKIRYKRIFVVVVLVLSALIGYCFQCMMLIYHSQCAHS